MRAIIHFLLKLIASLFMGIIVWCFLLMAIILWDKRFMQTEVGDTFIWKDPKK